VNSRFRLKTLSVGEFGWGGTSVKRQHRCPKESSMRTEISFASEKVTEAPKGALRLVGNQPPSVWVYSALDCETHRSSRDESRAK